MIEDKDYKVNRRTKEEIQEIAAEVHSLLKKKELPVWQYKEVLSMADDMLEHVVVKE